LSIKKNLPFIIPKQLYIVSLLLTSNGKKEEEKEKGKPHNLVNNQAKQKKREGNIYKKKENKEGKNRIG